MDYTAWARKHRKEIISRIVSKFDVDNEKEPLALFGAGIPGAGKTEFFNRLVGKDDNFVRIDLDEIVKEFPGYSPERYYEYRKAASLILDELFRYCRRNKLNFVLDGTFAHERTMENIEKALKTHQVGIFFLRQDPLKAWQLTRDREIVTKRGVSRDGFIYACLKIPDNIRNVLKKHGHDLTIVAIKRRNDNVGFDVIRDRREIDHILHKKYTKKELERIIPHEYEAQD